MKHAYFASALAVPLAFTAVAQAQESDLSGHGVAEVIVTGSPYRVSLDSTTTHVDVLNTDELLRANPGGLGDVLEAIPGLRSSAYGPGAARPIIRGLSGPRVLILQNGTGLVDASSLSPDHAVAADPGMASRVEILRGPSTLAYGGSAIGGVINVIDDRIASTPAKNGLEGRASGSYTTNGDGLAGALFLKKGTGPVVFTLDGEHREAGNYTAASNPVSAELAAAEGLTPLTDREVQNTDVSLNALGAGVSFIGSDGFIGLSVKHTTTTYGVPFAQDAASLPPGEVIAIDLAQTRYDLRGETSLEWPLFDKARLSVGYTDYEHVEIDRAAGGVVGTQFLSDGTEARLELVQRDRNGWQGAVGVQGLTRSFAALGAEAFIPAVDIEEAGLFTLQRYDAGRWGVEGGLRLDRRSLAADLAGRPTSDAAIATVPGLDWTTANARPDFENVSVSAGVFVRPADGLFLALSASRNARAPTEFELFSDGPHEGTESYQIGNPTLTSEKVDSVEATLRYRSGRFRAEAHIFNARYDGFIDEAPNGLYADDDGVIDPTASELPVYVYSQADASFRGGELELGYAVMQSPAGTLWLEAAVDTVRGNVGGTAPARIPPASWTARALWEGSRLETSLEVRKVADQDRVAPFELRTDGHTLVGARIGYKVFADKDVTVFAEGRNLTDQEAREHTSFLKDIAPRPGRSLRAGFTARF